MQNFTKLIGLLLFLCLSTGVKVLAQKSDSISVRLADSIARYKQDSLAKAKGAKISGIVKDAATGKAISGINVSVPLYSAAITDDKGHFTVEVPNFSTILIVSGQNFQQKEVAVKGRKTLPDILLFEDAFNSVYDEAKLPFGDVSIFISPWQAAIQMPSILPIRSAKTNFAFMRLAAGNGRAPAGFVLLKIIGMGCRSPA